MFGPATAVRTVIDVEQQPELNLLHRHPYDRVLQRMVLTRPPVLAFWRIPDAVRDVARTVTDLVAGFLAVWAGPLADSILAADFVRGIGVSLVPESPGWSVELMVLMPDARAAARLSGVVQIFQGLGSLVPEDGVPEADRPYWEAFRALSVRRDEELLILRWPLPDRLRSGPPEGAMRPDSRYGRGRLR